MSQILQKNAYCFILDSFSLHVVDVQQTCPNQNSYLSTSER